jgi:hypothetical protein
MLVQLTSVSGSLGHWLLLFAAAFGACFLYAVTRFFMQIRIQMPAVDGRGNSGCILWRRIALISMTTVALIMIIVLFGLFSLNVWILLKYGVGAEKSESFQIMLFFSDIMELSQAWCFLLALPILLLLVSIGVYIGNRSLAARGIVVALLYSASLVMLPAF